MANDSLKSKQPRRTYSKQFKAELVAQHLEGHTSLTSLAVDHGMNPNVLHRWVTEHQRYGKHTLQDDEAAPARQTIDMAPANWFALKPLQEIDDCKAAAPTPVAPTPERDETGSMIELDLAARGLTMKVRWPASEHKALAQWTRELFT
ncbi:transposase IS3/IS911 [Pusillimonas sp. T7-7]|uniref:transposase n=1 Tax=Pusillimonas sp. (strain T7-7) TaxID=1007105 RepID=UPI0002085469|nr:transposase [Pusillimonas sp. T7-7]AEC21379.1 transposase IS3/IS911 [Pusillimonas sp. T7-7]